MRGKTLSNYFRMCTMEILSTDEQTDVQTEEYDRCTFGSAGWFILSYKRNEISKT